MRRIGINSSLNVWKNSPMKLAGSVLCWEVLITDSIFLLVIGLFRFYMPLCFGFSRLNVSGIYPYLFNCPTCWPITIHISILRFFLYLCYQLHCNISSFFSDFIYLNPPFFSRQKFVNFIFSKNHQFLFSLIF